MSVLSFEGSNRQTQDSNSGYVACLCPASWGSCFVLQSVEPFLYQQNSASLCKGSLQRRVYCLVAVEPEEGANDGQPAQAPKTVDLARIRQLLQLSRQKYLAGSFA